MILRESVGDIIKLYLVIQCTVKKKLEVI